MVRKADNLRSESPVSIVIRFGHHYRHGDQKQHDQLFFFSPDKVICDKLLIFGGKVYRQYGGWRWMLGSKKQLVALAKLMEAEPELSNCTEMNAFVKRMQRIGKHE